MTASEVARVFHAKRIGRDKWRAVCPVHGGKHSGPLSIAKGHSGVIVKCFGGCDTGGILALVGLKWTDLFDGKPSPQVRARTSLYEVRESLERQLGLVIWLKALESGTQSSKKSDANYRQFDAALSRWQSTVNGAASSGK